MIVAWVFIFFSFLILAMQVWGQPGFISINCGIAEGSTYEVGTGIRYSSDAGFIDTGVNRNLPQVSFPVNLRNFYKTVRSFPNGTRNCYTLKPVEKGSKYLVRAYFLYGNYDGKNSTPQFDLYLDVNLWKTINDASTAFYTDIITVATMDFISVCLVNTSSGTPFISALELRPLNKSLYIASNETQSLLNINNFDLGSNSGDNTRYPDDPFDLIWEPSMDSIIRRQISTTLPVVTNKYLGFDPPSKVMKTAAKPANESGRLSIEWSVSDPILQIHIFGHFAELEQLKPNMTRELNMCCNDQCFGPFHPEYLVTTSVYNTIPLTGQTDYSCWFSKTSISTLPPILNAFEIYTVLQLSNTPTKIQEVEAMIDIKTTYKVKRNWMGDPCFPKDYLWEGLACNYPDSGSPVITSLDLSSSGLDGEITLSLANLMSIKSLDLSANYLNGTIPMFLGELPSLSHLNLTGNLLIGRVPSNLLERYKNGLLKLSLDNNPNLNFTDPSSNTESTASATHRKKIIIPVIASIASVIILSSLIILWALKWRKRGCLMKANKADDLIHAKDEIMYSENRRFTYAEVVKMTNNFERAIGSGGFGTVYHGQVRNGTQVAVKMLSLQSVKSLSHRSQGLDEFQNEVLLLTRMHHKNVVPFIGYCKEGDNMALIYEYMAKGNLASHLSGTSTQALSWSQRLRIALDVAQECRVLPDQFKKMVEYWESEGGKTEASRLSTNRSKKLMQHHSGTQTFVQLGTKMATNGVEPHPMDVFMKAYTPKDPAKDPQTVRMLEEISTVSQSQSSQGSEANSSMQPILTQVLGEGKGKYVRGLSGHHTRKDVATSEGQYMTQQMTKLVNVNQTLTSTVQQLQIKLDDTNNVNQTLTCTVQQLQTQLDDTNTALGFMKDWMSSLCGKFNMPVPNIPMRLSMVDERRSAADEAQGSRPDYSRPE